MSQDILQAQINILRQNFSQLRSTLTQKFRGKNDLSTEHTVIRGKIYSLIHKHRPSIQAKVELNRIVRNNIQAFIKDYATDILKEAMHQNSLLFIQTLTKLWNHYQIFVFSFHFCCEKLQDFFANFYCLPQANSYQYYTDQSQVNHEVSSIAVMGVNQLKKLVQSTQIVSTFVKICNQFLMEERVGISVPGYQILESIKFLQSCYYDMQAICVLDKIKPRIVKKQYCDIRIPTSRLTKDGAFANKYIVTSIIQKMTSFYRNFVQNEALSMNPIMQNNQMLLFINSEQNRCHSYIHSAQNRELYIKAINQNLIANKIAQRINKEGGFSDLLISFKDGNIQIQDQISAYWKLYSRQLKLSLPHFKRMFGNFMQDQAQKITKIIGKPTQFIQEVIKLNQKSKKIIALCGTNLQMQVIRNQKIRGILSNDVTESGKKMAKFNRGAYNMAFYINLKLRACALRSTQLDQSYQQCWDLFKILIQKSRFIAETHKFMAARMLDYYGVANLASILEKQAHLIEKIKVECGLREVTELSQIYKNVQKSLSLTENIQTQANPVQIDPLKSILVKDGSNWPVKANFHIQNPPEILKGSLGWLLKYFKQNGFSVRFEFTEGTSMFKGSFHNGNKNFFQLKNIYLMILLLLEQRSMTLAQLTLRFVSQTNIQAKPQLELELLKALVQLVHADLIICSTRITEVSHLSQVSWGDSFQINTFFDFACVHNRKFKGKSATKLPGIVNGQILVIPMQWNRWFQEKLKKMSKQDENIEAERRFKMECLLVKQLKHAHHSNSLCSFQQLFDATKQPKYLQYRITERQIKQVIEQLLAKSYCERVQGHKNVFRYIA